MNNICIYIYIYMYLHILRRSQSFWFCATRKPFWCRINMNIASIIMLRSIWRKKINSFIWMTAMQENIHIYIYIRIYIHICTIYIIIGRTFCTANWPHHLLVQFVIKNGDKIPQHIFSSLWWLRDRLLMIEITGWHATADHCCLALFDTIFLCKLIIY